MTANPAAYECPLFKVPGLNADVDLSNNQWQFCTLNPSNGNVVLSSVAGAFTLGVLQGKTSLGDPVEITGLGYTKAMGGVAIPYGAFVSVDANGKAKVAATGDRICGVAITPCGGANMIFTLYLYQGGNA